MKSQLRQTAIFLFFILGLAGCSQFPMLDQLVVKPKLEVASFALEEASILKQSFKIRVKVDNPNAFALPILGVNYGVTIAGVEVADGNTSKSVSIPAGGSDYLDLNVSTNLLKTLPDLRTVILKGDKTLPYAVTGSVKTNNAFISSVPFAKSGQFELKL
ncbi:MAG TPA: hypothetical protein DHW71_13585 [Gammaproteobacteria bacterium]|nr:hypothetical protein [Gammaproteobacteria bacterium]MEC8011189.1 LEA type 2 family protein [Pseudomonadota bacterium]HBF07064.1 hypothetical protein [Gammaproteobacteria bacterium]HCK94021.1 hypothetical protein [Gammaproteobacteria bacterium]|tara:strand:- start:6429 stop:6905 length:477 start_codon:yes stop_codon:yes gene_type:complete